MALRPVDERDALGERRCCACAAPFEVLGECGLRALGGALLGDRASVEEELAQTSGVGGAERGVHGLDQRELRLR
jgi:hypothetical protein